MFENVSYLDLLREQFNHHVAFRERRPGVLQLLAPLYHEDGDMMEIYLEPRNGGEERVRICDHGMTLMRLSYSFDLDTPNKERIFQKILELDPENTAMQSKLADLYTKLG